MFPPFIGFDSAVWLIQQKGEFMIHRGEPRRGDILTSAGLRQTRGLLYKAADSGLVNCLG